MTVKEAVARRPIRSFVRREGRITRSQQNAIDLHWPEFGLELDGHLNFDTVFSTPNRPIVMEIGFGMGASLVAMAAEQTQTNFLGVEVHRPGVGSLIDSAKKQQLQNIKVSTQDAKVLLQEHIKTCSLDKIMVLFPDPWHKKRHHKRRFINESSIQLMLDKIKPGGVLHIATDWLPYAQAIKDSLQQLNLKYPVEEISNLDQMNSLRKVTKFERRGQRLGHEITDILIRKQP